MIFWLAKITIRKCLNHAFQEERGKRGVQAGVHAVRGFTLCEAFRLAQVILSASPTNTHFNTLNQSVAAGIIHGTAVQIFWCIFYKPRPNRIFMYVM